MLFNTLSFLAFLVVVFGLYYLPPLQRFQRGILIGASFVFYAWTAPWLLILLVFCIALNTTVSFRLSRADLAAAKRIAAFGVVANLAVLGFFKYAKLFGPLVPPGQGALWTIVHLPLPIGISFYTFEGISLLIDTLRSKRNALPDVAAGKTFYEHLRNTSLFIVFFPHLIAGPILKARQFYPQIGGYRLADIDWEAAARSLILGYFLKTVVADNLREQTKWISYPFYETLSRTTAATLLFGYSIQIFADFAGYSLIAIGLAHLFGYRLPPNFNWPYISTSLGEFWRRWHISLSTWLRDYLYIPLGGNRLGTARTYLNLILVMTLGGLWHGAALSYAVWGLYHGIGLAAERFAVGRKDENAALPAWAYWSRVVLVFAFVTLGWLLFKLPNFGEALQYLRILARNGGPLDREKALPVFLYSLPAVLLHLYHTPAGARIREYLNGPSQRQWALQAAYAIALFACLTNGGSVGEFIYFQF